ncbi:MAG: toxin secretion/phage lysis holin [Herbinix sp.]|jgi:toxin secretion/phage lysis holin|nr:toxin secretion/phage lysis holin [Herbinix sp.]
MDRITLVKASFIGLAGAIGSFIANLFGGWTNDLVTLMIMMGIDFAMGLMIAAIWKKSGKSENGALSSWSAWKGLCRKGVSLLFVLIAFRLDIALGVEYIRTAVIIGFIINELISIVENAGIMGIPIPRVIIKAIDMLRSKEGDPDGTD